MRQLSRLAWLRYIPIFFITLYILMLSTYIILRLLFGDAVWIMASLNNFAPYYFLPLLLTIPVAMLLRTPRLTGLKLILLAVGVIWFMPRYIPNNITRAAPQTETTVKVVTFNVPTRHQQYDQVANWLREVDADIVLLQEVTGEWATQRGVPQLLDLYPHQVGQWEWGNTTLSKYPIVDQYDSRYLKVDIDGTVVALYNIHFWMPISEHPRVRLPVHFPYADVITRYDDRGRNDQINGLIARINTETLPFIVGGDFNMSDNAVKYHDLAAIMHDSFREAGVGVGASWPVAYQAGLPLFIPPLIRIDYIWHSDHFTSLSSELGPALDSDHRPVISTLALLTDSP